jgi:hypothetical protein
VGRLLLCCSRELRKKEEEFRMRDLLSFAIVPIASSSSCPGRSLLHISLYEIYEDHCMVGCIKMIYIILS